MESGATVGKGSAKELTRTEGSQGKEDHCLSPEKLTCVESWEDYDFEKNEGTSYPSETTPKDPLFLEIPKVGIGRGLMALGYHSWSVESCLLFWGPETGGHPSWWAAWLQSLCSVPQASQVQWRQHTDDLRESQGTLKPTPPVSDAWSNNWHCYFFIAKPLNRTNAEVKEGASVEQRGPRAPVETKSFSWQSCWSTMAASLWNPLGQ